MRQQLVTPILLKIAKDMRIKILIEPTRGIYGVILFDSGKKYYFKDVNFNLNLTASASLSKNKAATCYFLKEFGYNVPEFTMVYSEKSTRSKLGETVYEGLKYIETVGFPVIIKPNNMSQGSYIFRIDNEEDYFNLISEIFSKSNTAQIQKFYKGNDYRVVVLDKVILSAYQRVPLNVEGDGYSSISTLIDKKQQEFKYSGRDTIIQKNDVRLTHKLSRQDLSLNSILPTNKKVYLQDISNLSVGGESIEITNLLHPSFAELALNVASDMNLTLCGIDIITEDITQSNNGGYTIIEVNSSPGLDNYVYSNIEQETYVEHLYSQILTYIKDKYS